MNDMSAAIAPKSDQLNSDDLIPGPRTIRIRDVEIKPGEQPVSIFFDGDNGKPWKPCKSASRVLVAAWGPDANVYRGRSATIYRDDTVTWGGMKVGGIRISALSDMDRPLVIALTEKKGSKKIATIQPLTVEAAAPAFTIEAAEMALRTAKTEDDLRAEWTNPRMKPHQKVLKPVLDERKAALAEPPKRTDADAVISMYGDAQTQDDIAETDKAVNTLGVDPADVVGARADAVARVSA